MINHTFIQSVHLLGMVREANAILCCNLRASLLSGYYPHRLGLQRKAIERFKPQGLDTDIKILPEYLDKAGYKSHFVGKWHLGK